jgi:hypothetical protein
MISMRTDRCHVVNSSFTLMPERRHQAQEENPVSYQYTHRILMRATRPESQISIEHDKVKIHQAISIKATYGYSMANISDGVNIDINDRS